MFCFHFSSISKQSLLTLVVARIIHVCKEVLYLGIKTYPQRAAASDLVQRRTLLVYVEGWRTLCDQK